MLNEFLKKEAPIQGLAGMGGGVPSRLLTLASGTTTYVEDVFSTFLYDGTGSAQTITNGIDLDGEGGAVWFKNRSNTNGHRLVDTERGATKSLEPHDTNAEATESDGLTAFTSTGFSIGTQTHFNGSGNELCSWAFRKCRGFFDIVTYTGNATAGRTIAHNLGSVPGSIWVKRLNGADNWTVYHRGMDSSSPEDYLMYLNTDAARSDQDLWADTAPTDSVFSVGDNVKVNGNDTNTYVAYLFAHNDGSFGEDSDEAVIKCGSYTGDGSNTNFVTLGFEPQFLLIKNATTGSTNWMVFDVMRGLPDVSGATARAIYGNTNAAETSNNAVCPSATGFTPKASGSYTNTSGDTFIYIAIRRPHKPPEAGTDVFKPELLTSDSQTFNPGFAPDMNWHMFDRSSSSGFAIVGTRLTGNESYVQTYSTAAQGGGTNWEYDAPTGKFTQSISSGSTSGGIEYFFKRAPGFLDIVTWTGNGVTGRTINHNLGVAPEFMIVKRLTGTENWYIYHKQPGATKAASFNLSGFGSAGVWDDTEPTATTVALMGDNAVNGSTESYVGYFFASLDGISKVGSYSGGSSASNIDIDCGFTAGARFVLIKRTDNYTSTANWFIYDSARGIVSGNDPYLKLNGGQEVTSTDYIDPLNAGFTVTSSAPSGMNGDDGTFMFLAIA